jgi:hypothetical protein
LRQEDTIIESVCTYYHVERHQLLGKHRGKIFVRPRHVAMHLLYSTGMTFAEIGRIFRVDHSSVHYGVHGVQRDMRHNVEFRRQVKELESIQTPGPSSFHARQFTVNATQQHEPFTLGGQQYEAGDYIVMNGSTFALQKDIFEKLFKQVESNGTNN